MTALVALVAFAIGALAGWALHRHLVRVGAAELIRRGQLRVVSEDEQ